MNRMTGMCSMLAGLLLSTQALAIGAIAVDRAATTESSGYGYSLGYASQKEAETAAIDYCRQYGGTDCQSVVWFQTCGAYAESLEFYGIGWGASRAVAEQAALSQCNDSDCKVLVSKCEGDK